MVTQNHLKDLPTLGLSEFHHKKRCVIQVADTNPDTNLGSAVVVAIHKLKSDHESKLLVKNQNDLKRVEKKRATLIFWATGKLGHDPKTIADFQEVFRNKYQIIECVTDSNKIPIINFMGPPHETQLCFFKDENGLYNVVTSIKALCKFKYLCQKCYTPQWRKKNKHQCKFAEEIYNDEDAEPSWL